MKAVKNYLKNVTKSIAFATADITKEMMPNTGELAESNKEFFTATYAALRNPPAAIKKGITTIQNSKVYQAVDYGAKNLVEDLRTGNFYNKEREDRDLLKYAGLDTNWDDLSEFGIEDDWESNIGKDKSESSEVTAGDRQVVQAVEGSIAASTNTTVAAVLQTSDMQVKNSRINTAMLYKQNEKLFSGLHNDLSVVDNTIKAMHNLLATSLQNMDSNMANFFTQEVNLSTERNKILKEMLEMQRNQYKSAAQREDEARKRKPGRARWKDVSLSGGMLNIDAYLDAVKQNISAEVKGMGIAGFSEDSNMLATFMVSPLKGLTKMLVDGIIPATVKEASRELDDSISGIFGNIIGRLANARDDVKGTGNTGILGMIGRFFGVSTRVNSSLDVSKYEKGPVPFDGITRKAVIDVIPTYLRRIEAAITGRPERGFDYKTGTWKNMNDAYKEYKSRHVSYVKSATNDVMNGMKPGFDAVKISDKTEADRFKKAQEEFADYLYEVNFEFYPEKSASANGVNPLKYPNFSKYYDIMAMIWKNSDVVRIVDKKGRVKTRSMHSVKMQGASKVLDAKDREEQEYRNMEAEGGFISQYFAAGGKKAVDQHGKWNDEKNKFTYTNRLTELADSLGNTVYDYLRNINKELTWQRLSWGTGGGAGGGSGSGSGRARRSRGRNNNPTIDFDRISLTNTRITEQSNRDAQKRAQDVETHRKRIEADLAAGKGVDFSYYESDPELFNEALNSVIHSATGDKYANAITAHTDKNALTKWASKVYGDSVGTTKELEDAVKKANREAKDEAAELDEEESSFLSRILTKISGGKTIISAATSATTESITNMMYLADEAVYNMFFKAQVADEEGGEQYDGFLDMLSKKTQKLFKDTSSKLEENILNPFKEKFTEAFESLTGVSTEEFKERFTGSIKNMGSKAWSAFKEANKDVYTPLANRVGEMAGIKSATENMRTSRAEARKQVETDLAAIDGLDLGSEEFQRIMLSVGLNYTDYDTKEDAVKDLVPALQQKMYQNSGNDFVTREQAKIAYHHIANTSELRQKYGKETGIAFRGNTQEEIANNFEEDLIKGLAPITGLGKDNRRTAVTTNTGGVGIRRDKMTGMHNDSRIAIFARMNGFTGSADEKRQILKSMGADPKDIEAAGDDDNKLNWVYFNNAGNAKGTMRPFAGQTMLSKNELVFNADGTSIVPETGLYNLDKPSHILNSESSYDLLTSLGVDSGKLGVKSTVEQDLARENLMADRIAKHAVGTIKISGNQTIDGDEYLNEAKSYIPEMAAGGVVGGAISLMLGLVGGPLVGGAVGAATSLISRSDKFKDLIFGKDTDEGRQGGLISKTVMDTVKKYAPDMLKYGMAGIIPGLLTPLGPLGGLMVGAGVGFLKNNKSFTEKYMGKVDSVKFSQKEKDIIEKMAPNILKGAGIGAVATLFGGPFGLAGNAAIGAAMGMMASSEEFKEGVLGRVVDGERIGGILGGLNESFKPIKDSLVGLGDSLVDTFNNNIIDPLERFATPFIHELPNIAAAIPNAIAKKLAESESMQYIESKLNDLIQGPLSGIVNFGTKMVGNVANIVTSPVRLLGTVGDRMRTRQIQEGRADYMTARERVGFLNNTGQGDKVSRWDEALMTIGSNANNAMTVDKAKELMENLETVGYTGKETSKAFGNSVADVDAILNKEGIDAKSKKRVRSALSTGDVELAIRYLNSITRNGEGLSENERDKLLGEKGLQEAIEKAGKAYATNERIKNLTDADKDASMQKVQEALASMGIKLSDDPYTRSREIQKMINNLDTEITDREANGQVKLDKVDEERISRIVEPLNRLGDLVSEIKDAIIGEKEGTTDQAKTDNEAVKENISKANEANELESAERRRNALREAGPEKAEKLSDEVIQEATRANTTGINAKIAANKYNPTDDKNGYNRIINKKNANVSLFGSKNLSAADINVAGGTQLGIIDPIKGAGLNLDEKAIKRVNAIANSNKKTSLKNIERYIKNASFRRIYKGYTLTVEDIDFMTSRPSNTFKERIKIIDRAGQKWGDGWAPLKQVTEASDTDIQTIVWNTPSLQDSLKTRASNTIQTLKSNIFGGQTVNAAEEDEDTEEETPTTGEDIPKHALGSLISLIPEVGPVAGAVVDIVGGLVGGTVKTAGKVVKGLAKAGTNAVGGLVNGVFNGISGVAGGLTNGVSTALSSVLNSKNGNQSAIDQQIAANNSEEVPQGVVQDPIPVTSTTSGNLDETDKKDDGVDQIQVGTKIVPVVRKSDGSIEIDESDTTGKEVLDDEKKRQEQAEENTEYAKKTSEVLTSAFDTTDEEGSKKGKLSWWKILLGGTFLLKSGLLSKLYEGVIKPGITSIVTWFTEGGFETLASGIVKGIKSIFTGIGDLAKDIANGLGYVIYGNSTDGGADGNWPGIGTAISNWWNENKIGDLFSDIGKDVKEGISYLWEGSDEPTSQWKGIKALWNEDICPSVKTLLFGEDGEGGLANTVMDGLSYFWNEYGNPITSAIADAIGTIINKALGIEDDQAATLDEGGVSTVVNGVSEATGWSTGTTNLSKKSYNSIRSYIKKQAEYAEDDATKTAYNNIYEAMANALESLDKDYNSMVAQYMQIQSNGSTSQQLPGVSEDEFAAYVGSINAFIDQYQNNSSGVWWWSKGDAARQLKKYVGDSDAIEEETGEGKGGRGLLSKLGLADETGKGTLAGMGYVKQIDPSVRNLPFNASYDTEYQTIGDSACGPAAAVNAVRAAYGRGSSDLVAASNYALNGGYKEQNGGTYPEFFTDYFNSNGLEATTSYDKNSIASNIMAGNPTVLMGQDNNGTSSSTPFGKTSHYVTVTGVDNNGYAVVQDPESQYDNQLYDINDLMKKTTLGVSAYGKNFGRGIKNKIRKSARGKFGRGLTSFIFVGDSRTVGMQDAVGSNGHRWLCKTGAGISWFKSQITTISSMANSKQAIVILMGINDITTDKSYESYANVINQYASQWKAKGSEVYFVSVNPVRSSGYNGITNSIISSWNNNIQQKLDSNVVYIDTFTSLENSIQTTDGLHYTSDQYLTIYNMIVKAISGIDYATETNTSSSSSSNTNSDDSTTTTTSTSLFDKLQNLLLNSKAGLVLTSLFSSSTSTSDDSSSVTTSTNSSNSTSTTTAGNVTVSGSASFPTYDLTDAQLKGVANIIEHEQPMVSGYMAEASLMANLTDIAGDENATPQKLENKATSGWFANGYDRFYNYGSPSEAAIEAARTVLVEGKRTLPRYVNEHDCESDITSVTNDGVGIDKTARDQYVAHKTVIKNRMGSTYKFHSFPNSKSDPFGYTSDTYREKWGDDCYSTSTTGTGKFGRGKFGRSKYGRGYDGNVWYALRQAGATESGAAAVMGNLEAESGMEPTNLQNTYEKSLGYSDQEYTNAVDNGTYTNFVNDEAGYGLAQWTYYSRKQGLKDAVDEAGASIADIGTQLSYLLSELSNGYKTLWNKITTSNNLSDISNLMLHDFENPKVQDTSVERKRASMGQAWYSKYTGTEGDPIEGVTLPGEATSGSNSGDSDSSESSTSTSLFDKLSNLLIESDAGQVLSSFLGLSSSSSTSTTSSDSSSSSSGNTGTSVTLGDSDAANMVNIAMNELGTKETGVNYVKYNDWYWGDGVGGSDYPWCAAFVSWVANQAGVSENIMPKTAATKTSYTGILQSNGTRVQHSDAKAGDIAFFSDAGTYDGISHTGIVTGTDSNNIYTVEGNSSDAVSARYYAKGAKRVLLTRPAYENQGTSSDQVNIISTNATEGSNSSTLGSNGYKPVSKYGTFKQNLYGTGNTHYLRSNDGYAKTEESEADRLLGLEKKSYDRKHVYTNMAKQSGNGTMGKAATASTSTTVTDYNSLLKAIIEVLMTIADNTDKLNTIVTLISNYTGVTDNATATEVSDATSMESLKSKVNGILGGIAGSNTTNKLSSLSDGVADTSLTSIVNALNEIASE